jgi:hypothetical protein
VSWLVGGNERHGGMGGFYYKDMKCEILTPTITYLIPMPHLDPHTNGCSELELLLIGGLILMVLIWHVTERLDESVPLIDLSTLDRQRLLQAPIRSHGLAVLSG